MSKRNDLMQQAELLEKIDKLEARIAERGKATATQQKQLNKAYQESFKQQSQSADLGKKIDNFNKSILGKVMKRVGFDKHINALAKVRENGNKKDIKDADKFLDIMNDVVSGRKTFSEGLNDIAEGDFGKLQTVAVSFGNALSKSNGVAEKMIKIGNGVHKTFSSVSETLLGINVAETLSAAGALAAITSFLGKALEVKQTLGTTAVESA